MAERIQPGGRVDQQVYERFKDFVEDLHGQTRGALGEELEKAMQDRMQAVHGKDQLTRIEDDVAKIKAQLAQVSADGGTPATPTTPSSGSEVRAPADHADVADDTCDTRRDVSPGEKPPANQPRSAKVEWLAKTFIVQNMADRNNDGGGGSFVASDVRDHVDDAYAFEPDTIREYVPDVVDAVTDMADTTTHPQNETIHMYGDYADQMLEKIQGGDDDSGDAEGVRDEARDRMDEIT